VLAIGFIPGVGIRAQPAASEETEAPEQPRQQPQGEPEEPDGSPAEEAGAEEIPAGPEVLRMVVDMAIHPVAVQFVRDALEEARRSDAQALVIQINTPGGLVVSMREICTAMLGSPVPVVVYVAPAGSQAASAGFYILMASDIAAMAPSTNAGAAATVTGQGEDVGETMARKVDEDGAAYMRSLAKRKGRNVELAESAVREATAKSFSAEEALEGGLIELIAPSLTRLLTEIDGREVEKNGRQILLETADATIRDFEMSAFQRFLAVLANPNIAAILLSLGFMGLYFELMNPGAIFPGVLGAICLLLGFFGLSVLPVNYVGVALIALAVAFFIAEIKVTSFGLLTAAGAVSLVLGLLMLFKTPEPALRVSLGVVVAVAATAVVLVLFLLSVTVKTFRRQVQTGKEGLVGERGVVKADLAPRGKVWVHGELWHAEAPGVVSTGQEVEVTAVQGMRLRVRPVAASPASPPEPRGTGEGR
jgi:membrane-bound serine protease (ClpP class)